MSKSIEVTFTPAEFDTFGARDLSATTCVVLDILRATTSMTVALANGARAILPVETIADAVALKSNDPGLLLAGERDGVRILADVSGGADFDLGNSPREFIAERVAGRTIAMTTTNGTRALKACIGARQVLIGSFLNMRSVVNRIEEDRVDSLLIVCAGTGEEAAYEDVIGAGALCDMLWPEFVTGHVADSAEVARQNYRIMQRDLVSAMQYSRNGRRLLAMPELAEDVRACLQRETHTLVCGMNAAGEVTSTGVSPEG